MNILFDVINSIVSSCIGKMHKSINISIGYKETNATISLYSNKYSNTEIIIKIIIREYKVSESINL